MVVKISMLPSVSVIYVRIDHKLISILIINKRREKVDWEVWCFLKKKKCLTKVVLHYTCVGFDHN